MSNRDRYSQQQLIDAIVQAKGIKSAAADGLGCSRQTITNYINRYPAVKEAYQDAIDRTVDLAQSKLIVLVEKEEWPAIRFLLATLGKDRGFTEGTEKQNQGTDLETLRKQFEAEVRKVYGSHDKE